MKASRLIGLVIAGMLWSGAAFSADQTIGSCSRSGHEAVVSLRGAIICGSCHHEGACVSVHAGDSKRCTMSFRTSDGATYALAADSVPGLDSLMGARDLTEEVRGVFVERGGTKVLRIDQVSLLDARGAIVKYPVRGRCQHCGCRMQLDAAADAVKKCDVCPCKKSATECLGH